MEGHSDRNVGADPLARFVWSGRAGDYVFHRGDASTDLFIVESGEIELLVADDDVERRLTVVGPGELLGEAEALNQEPRRLSARALGECRLLRLDTPTLVGAIKAAPELALHLLRGLSGRSQSHAGWRDEEGARTVAGPPAGDLAPRFIEVSSGRVFACPVSISSAENAGPGDIEVTIGRSDRRTGRAPVIDFTPVDSQRSLSRSHARLLRRGERVFLREERGAHNGTFVNGQRLLPDAEVQLSDGDRVRFAMVETIFRQTREHSG